MSACILVGNSPLDRYTILESTHLHGLAEQLHVAEQQRGPLSVSVSSAESAAVAASGAEEGCADMGTSTCSGGVMVKMASSEIDSFNRVKVLRRPA